MIKIGDKVEILDTHCSSLTVGSRHIVTGIRKWKEHNRRIVSIGKWLFPADYLKRVNYETLSNKSN